MLFVSHDAWRTGAPILLLRFLRWLKATSSVPFLILLRDGAGDLRAEFEALGTVFAWDELRSGSGAEPRESPVETGKDDSHLPGETTHRAGHRPDSREAFRRFLDHADVGLIYSNTITNGDVLQVLADPKRPVITHVHELEHWIANRVEPSSLERCLKHTSRFIAVSQAVKDSLVRTAHVAADRIDVINGFVSTALATPTEPGATLRSRLGILPDDFVVVASGTTDWRKGPEIFVQLAAIIMRGPQPPQVHFLWVGGENCGLRFAELWHDVVRTGLEPHMHFVGIQTNPLDYFAAADVFALTSREDPFPLVCLEAAALGVPIVCFDKSGGMSEFVEGDAGVVVPYLDLIGMAEAILQLRANPHLRSTLGRRAKEKIRLGHDEAVVCPKILTVIQDALASGAGSGSTGSTPVLELDFNSRVSLTRDNGLDRPPIQPSLSRASGDPGPPAPSPADLAETLLSTQGELRRARTEIDALHRSLSWRITRPLRLCYELFNLRRFRR